MKSLDVFEIEIKSGKYLSKFCTLNTNALQILINSTLYFSAPKDLNDPLDCRIQTEIKSPENFNNETVELIRASYFYNHDVKYKLKCANLCLGDIKHQKEFFDFLFDYWQNNYMGICSFTRLKSVEENLLWSHYADEGKGFCLIFDKTELLASIAKNTKSKLYKLRKRKVNYDGVKPATVILYKNGEFEYTVDHLFSKTHHWSHENEYRITSELVLDDPRYLPLDPLTFERFVQFERTCLKYVVLGERMQKQERAMVKNIIDKICPEVELYEHRFD